MHSISLIMPLIQLYLQAVVKLFQYMLAIDIEHHVIIRHHILLSHHHIITSHHITSPHQIIRHHILLSHHHIITSHHHIKLTYIAILSSRQIITHQIITHHHTSSHIITHHHTHTTPTSNRTYTTSHTQHIQLSHWDQPSLPIKCEQRFLCHNRQRDEVVSVWHVRCDDVERCDDDV